MFCKNCGAQIEDSAKFCTSCGVSVVAQEPVVEEEYNDHSDEYQESDYTEQENNNEVPWQFSEGYRNVGESGTSSKTIHEKKFFKGQSISTGTSGSISFGNKERKGLFGKLFKFAIIGVVVIIAITLLFGGSPDTIENLTTTDVINIETYEPVGSVEDFDDWIDRIYITFTTNDLVEGQVISAQFYIEDTYIGSNSIVSQAPSENVYFSHIKPDDGWLVGYVYRVEIYVDGEFMDSTLYRFE